MNGLMSLVVGWSTSSPKTKHINFVASCLGTPAVRKKLATCRDRLVGMDEIENDQVVDLS